MLTGKWKLVISVSTCTGIFAGAILILIINHYITIGKRLAAYSQVASISSYIESNYSDKFGNINTIFDANFGCLNEADYNLLAERMWQARVIDTGGRANTAKELFLDPWKQLILIAGAFNNGTLDFIVSSKGQDKKFGTNDDIFYCFDANNTFYYEVLKECP